jgi:hypothetical protein
MLAHHKGECVVKMGDTTLLEEMKVKLESRDLLVTLDKND